MWIGVVDATYGTSIQYAWFNYAYANYGGGWYWVEVGPDRLVYVYASGYNKGSAYTDGWESFRVGLTKPSTGKKK
jgi:hypothetical protein